MQEDDASTRKCDEDVKSGNSRYQMRKQWPAAAVIPAPIAYIKVVAVKKLVVELRPLPPGPPIWVCTGVVEAYLVVSGHVLYWAWSGTMTFTLKKLECSKQAYARIH